jgi:O-acetyl-ADP-ribose deacetylase (regulator of RNase III)
MIQIQLVDRNINIVNAWKKAFEGEPNVEITHGDITDSDADVLVTPTNSRGNMSGGVDAAIKAQYGSHIEARLKQQIVEKYEGKMPVGHAVLISTDLMEPRFVVAAPTMEGESDDLRRTKNTALACAAAFQAIHTVSATLGDDTKVAIPGLGAGTGQVSPETCAELMKIGYVLFRRQRYPNFEEMLKALNQELLETGKPQIAAVAPPVESLVAYPEGFPPVLAQAGKLPSVKVKVAVKSEEKPVPNYSIGTKI